MQGQSRRGFVTAAGATALSYSRILGANDRVRMGYIGVGNRGDQVHDAFLEWADQETVAVCDLREDYMDLAVKESRATPRKYDDYRKLLNDKGVDAVVIATPDHWHALMFIDACRAGKDVYCEKPLSLTVYEGRRMVQAAEETRRVVQVGLNRRSSAFLQEAAEFVRAGGIGQVTMARSYHLVNEWPLGIGPASPRNPPSEEEWEKWLGPAPKVPYDKNRMYYRFRWFYHYSGGQVTNFGVHYMDVLRWCLGKEAPLAVTGMGGKYAVEDNREVPDTAEILWDFGGTMTFSQINCNAADGNLKGSEMELRGTKGTMYIDMGRWDVVPENNASLEIPARTPLDRASEKSWPRSRKPAMEERHGKGSIDPAPHARNFLDCIRSRKQTNCDTLTGHLSTAATLIGNVALRTRSHLEWDAKAERFPNNAAANQWLSYQYRAPYKLG
jgi:predicted dehydrogenase